MFSAFCEVTLHLSITRATELAWFCMKTLTLQHVPAPHLLCEIKLHRSKISSELHILHSDLR